MKTRHAIFKSLKCPKPAGGHWFIYLLECSDNSLYCGSTNDLIKRVKDHNSGHGARYTRSRTPLKLVYFEKLDSKTLALKREHEIKSLPRKRKTNLIVVK